MHLHTNGHLEQPIKVCHNPLQKTTTVNCAQAHMAVVNGA